MKRIILAGTLLLATLACASCDDSKACYCFESSNNPQGYNEYVVYADYDTPCSSLGSDSRGCVSRSERNDPSFDPSQIAK